MQEFFAWVQQAIDASILSTVANTKKKNLFEPVSPSTQRHPTAVASTSGACASQDNTAIGPPLSPTHSRKGSALSTSSTIVGRPSLLTRQDSVSTLVESYSSSHDGRTPPPSSLEYFNFLVKVWKEKAQAERRDFRRNQRCLLDVEGDGASGYSPPAHSVAGPKTVSNQPSVSANQTPRMVGVCTKEELKPIYNPDLELKKISRRLLRCQKYALAISLISINATLIFSSWYTHRFCIKLTLGGGLAYTGYGCQC